MNLSTRLRKLTTLVISAFLLAPILGLAGSVSAESRNASTPAPVAFSKDDSQGNGSKKIARDLEDTVSKAIRKGKGHQVTRVIVQLNDNKNLSDSDVDSKLGRSNGKLKNRFHNMGLFTADLPLSRIAELQNDDDIAYISPDRPVASFGHVETSITAGQDDGRTEVTGFSSLNGTGVGIAVLDSGIDDTHNLIKASAGRPAVVYAKTYTGIAANRDYNGHGTHVASLLAGSPNFKSNYYGGIAYESKIISLGVLDGTGKGFVSNVIAALDWCIANKATYNIRVINMSLGAPPEDSYKTDPLCLAARRAYNAGIVVVVAAGNRGKNALGQKVYGGIDSPGIEPSVITVGATNSFGTDTRTDDKVTSYSSRGPTRGYTTTSSGIKKYDNLIKPDIVAPGNKLIGAMSPSSANKLGSLTTLFPSLKIGSSPSADQMMYLSGTSMSAPLVAGAAAMMLEANPNLTPGLVKAILMYTAQPLRNFNSFEQGAGQVNTEGAVRIASLVKSNASTFSNGTSMLISWDESSQHNDMSASGERIDWGRGIVADFCILYGSELMTKWQGMYAQSKILADGTSVTNGVISKNVSLVSSGVNYSSGVLTTTGVLISDGTLFTSGVLLSDGVLLADGVLLSDGVLISDGVLLADGVLISDGVLLADALVLGEGSKAMQPAP